MIRFESFNATAPDSAIIGIIGEDGSGKSELLRLAVGARYLGPDDTLNFDPVDVLLLDRTLARHDSIVRTRAALALNRLRLNGSTIVIVSHDEELLRQLCDEIWWLHEGKLAGRGEPGEMLRTWHEHVARRLRAEGDGIAPTLAPAMRRGDGRAQILSVELLGESGESTSVWRSGEPVVVRVTVRFHADVADPVVGMLIRTRIGLNVYGTNTELENLKLGPRESGDELRISFAFRSNLCPAEYTLTIASHDPDGVWHEWLEDAVAFSVVDSRYTAGVANLRAQVTFDILKT